ncbi:tetratricopeptide repeat-containing sensor histidine kinase [Flavobacterium channae]|uniref:tetratricopeptide repeat-containing sensor histidine kinase n=1 Tax=Flavobacterium channae TaxID=2897181 RepID=UPI001E3C8C90|nr:sensor histidine kinase [Flavobacterium channae]UGS23158.1 sensor histidine kinase [Flavobacterium channae]
MKNTITYLFAIFISQLFTFSWSQTYTTKQIDSVLNMPYDDIVANTSKSLQLFNKILSDAKKQNYKLGIANSYDKMALCYFYQNKYDLQSKYIFMAIDYFNQLKQYDKVASLYGSYGYHLKKRNLDSGILYMQKGLKIGEKHNAEYELRAIYDNYGVLKEMKKEYDSAFLFYNKSLTLKEKANDKIGIPYSLNKIGMLQLTLKQFAKAKQNLDKAYQIRLEIDDKIGIAENLNFYGYYYFETKDHQKSIEYFNKALDYSKTYNYNYLTQDNYQKLSELYELNSDYKTALDNFKNYTIYKDSISNINLRIKQAELDTEFDTVRKEKEILTQKADLAVKNTYIVIIVSLLILSIIVGYFMLKNQKIKTLQLQKENELKDALLKIETQNRLQEQRLQISRDLHDNIGAQLTFIISSLDSLKYGFAGENPKLEDKLNRISSFTKETIYELRDTIWAMNKEEITIEDLKTRISNFIDNAQLSLNGIEFNFNFDTKSFKSFSSRDGMNIYRLIQEAVNNAIKHANASQINVSFKEVERKIKIIIQDNGKGFSTETTEIGNGLNSMKKRAKELNGDFTIETNKQGTSIYLSLHNLNNIN